MSKETVSEGIPDAPPEDLASRVFDLEMFRIETGARLAAIESTLIGIVNAVPLKLEGGTSDLNVHLVRLTEANLEQAIRQLADFDPRVAAAITKRLEHNRQIRGEKF